MTGIPRKPNAVVGLFRAAFGSTGVPRPEAASSEDTRNPSATVVTTRPNNRVLSPEAEILLNTLFKRVMRNGIPPKEDFEGLIVLAGLSGQPEPQQYLDLMALAPGNKLWEKAVVLAEKTIKNDDLGI
jgi:hypothetical protein